MNAKDRGREITSFFKEMFKMKTINKKKKELFMKITGKMFIDNTKIHYYKGQNFLSVITTF